MLVMYVSTGRRPREALAVERVDFQTRERKILYTLPVMTRGQIEDGKPGEPILVNLSFCVKPCCSQQAVAIKARLLSTGAFNAVLVFEKEYSLSCNCFAKCLRPFLFVRKTTDHCHRR